jgi:hypothetical protein
MYKRIYMATACVIALASAPGLANAKGCLKGAAVGGVGGHVAGHHGLIAAAAGCAIGHHAAKKNEAAQKAAPKPTRPSPAPQTASEQPGALKH